MSREIVGIDELTGYPIFSERKSRRKKEMIEVVEVKEDNKMVIHPEHYNKEGRKECWDEMIEIFGEEAVAIFDILSAYKYHYRAGDKEGNPEEQDVAKIKNYMNHSADLIIDNKLSNVASMYIVMEKKLNEV